MLSRSFLKNPLYLIALSIVVGIVLVLLFYSTVKLEEKVEATIFKISTSDVLQIAQNNARAIQSHLSASKDYIKDIQNSARLQNIMEKHLKIMPTKNIKYAFLVYRDTKGVFRFLVDASKPSEKAFMNQKFDVVSDVWNEVFEKKKPQVIKHSLLKELSISYLVPILNKDKVELILAIDFSIKKIEKINDIIALMKKAILGTIIIITLFSIILIFQSFRYFVVKKSAYIDKLTNVYNRNYLHELQDFINLEDYVLATLDIDHFKRVNDTYGHSVGDAVLKGTASIIQNSVRKNEDIIIRYGGEEFIVFSKIKRNDKLDALNVIERIHANIKKHTFSISPNDHINITVSVGVNLMPQKSRTFQEAFKLTDIALYKAKSKGRNTIEVYEDNDDPQSDSIMHISDINSAIEEDRVICYFQKIVDTQTQTVVHYEALLKIVDKNGDIITPDRILPAIQGTFILRNITKRVLSICYKKLLEDDKILINVNLNPQDIINEAILDILKNYAKEENIANRLGIEIVESEDIINYKNAKNNLLMLKKLGYKIFIDDFGSGYSNFIYLTEIQTDCIKIDGNIIKKMIEDKASYLVVKSVVDFAKALDIKVVAEYVSNEEIYEKIKSLGIEYSQGYLFSIPKPLESS